MALAYLSQFQSTLPAWGATKSFTNFRRKSIISIHAPRMGSDKTYITSGLTWGISIHAPRMGSDANREQKKQFQIFQSTLPAWGATMASQKDDACNHFNPRSPHGERQQTVYKGLRRMNHFNPRSPHGERLELCPLVLPVGRISIHAPRMGSDICASSACSAFFISIHAPRMGSDCHPPPFPSL